MVQSRRQTVRALIAGAVAALLVLLALAAISSRQLRTGASSQTPPELPDDTNQAATPVAPSRVSGGTSTTAIGTSAQPPELPDEDAEPSPGAARAQVPPALPDDQQAGVQPSGPVTATTPTGQITQQTNPDQVSFRVGRGWNLLTVPYTLRLVSSNAEPFKEFAAAKRLRNGRYVDIGVELPAPGEAFWVSSSVSGVALLTDTLRVAEPISNAPVTASLVKGWNIVGNPYTESLSLNERTLSFETTIGTFTFSQALERRYVSPIFVYDTTASQWRELSSGDRVKSFRGFAVQSGSEITLRMVVR